MSRSRLVVFLLLTLVLALPSLCFAHPMGNFSVNHYSKLTLEGDRVRLQYVIDLAEIPTFQELQQGNLTSGSAAVAPDPSSQAVKRFIAQRGLELSRGLALSLNGKPILLRLKSSQVIFPPGAGGLPTLKMAFFFEAFYPPGFDRAKARLQYADGNYPGHTGWKEITATAPGGTLTRSSVPSTDRSAELTNYPTDLLNSPPQDLEAALEAALSATPPATLEAAEATPQVASKAVLPSRTAPTLPATIQTAKPTVAPSTKPFKGVYPTTHPKAQSTPPPRSQSRSPITPTDQASTHPALLRGNRQTTPRDKFTELITAQHLSPWFLFTAALLAMGLGALHALEPGHGKTIVAAYLVGSRGTARHAALLGLIVTLSHTAGVFALGAITLFASRYIVPEQLYPWLGVLSGLTIAALGSYMFLRRLTGTATDHRHGASGLDGHFTFFKRSSTPASSDQPDLSPEAMEAGPSALVQISSKRVSLPQLFALGITGGIIPCPAALIVLLSALALHRIALGFFLIVAFSLGLAAVLIAFGMLMVYARRFMAHLQIDGPLTQRWLPLASSAFITVLGVGVTLQALAAAHLGRGLFSRVLFSSTVFSKERLGPVLFVTGLGLILGMRHSTDADHVVAISTIVTRQRSIRGAAIIGSVWGLGHTITICAVGALIILFGVQIPPRIGLSMEFCVALMLIVLGLLNLSGLMGKITSRLTPTLAPRLDALPTSSSTDNYLRRIMARLGLYQLLRPLVIGLVHGLAGSAAVALLVLSTIHDPIKATLYLVIFGLGTMFGMMAMTAAMAVPLAFAGDRFTQLSRYLGIASGLVSLCFGTFLVYQLGYLGGLFTKHPQWTPQ